MRALTKEEIISAFSRKDQKKLKSPDLKIIDWETIDYFSWFHPSGHLAFIVYDNGLSLRGLILEKNKPGYSLKAKMCGWCKTVRRNAGVTLFSTCKVNDPSTVIGEFICADLQCSYYIRGLKGPLLNQMRETISTENKIFRLIANIDDFFNRSFNNFRLKPKDLFAPWKGAKVAAYLEIIVILFVPVLMFNVVYNHLVGNIAAGGAVKPAAP